MIVIYGPRLTYTDKNCFLEQLQYFVIVYKIEWIWLKRF